MNKLFLGYVTLTEPSNKYSSDLSQNNECHPRARQEIAALAVPEQSIETPGPVFDSQRKALEMAISKKTGV